MLVAALLFTGESRSEEVPPSLDLYQNGSLASGLFRTSADAAEIAIIRGVGLISEVMKRTDFLLPDADGVAPKIGIAGELASRIIAAEGGPFCSNRR